MFMVGRTEPLPVWVAVTPEAFDECRRALCRLHGMAEDRDCGARETLHWLAIGEVSPMTARPTLERSWEAARAESWVALCRAAGQPGPTARDWERLRATPRPARDVSRGYAYGAWRALAWLLGVREDWPAYTAWHRNAELSPERPHVFVPAAQRDTPAWRAAALAAGERDEADALLHWRHVRQLADTTDNTAGSVVSGPVVG